MLIGSPNWQIHRFYNEGKQNLDAQPLSVYKIQAALNPEGKMASGDNKNRINLKIPSFGKFKVFPENHEPSWKKRIILDPGSDMYLQWNRVFLCSCILALFVDPLFFYLPAVANDGNSSSSCMATDLNIGIVVTCFRTFADIFYLLNMLIKFRTAYVSPSSRVFGRGELVMDPKLIAFRYLRSEFFIDLVAILPLPQVSSQSLNFLLRKTIF